MEWQSNKKRNEKIKKMLLAGDSISYIARQLGCSKSTVYYYAKRIEHHHNNETLKRIKDNAIRASKASCDYFTQKRIKYIAEAKQEWKHIKNDPKMMLFLGLYWGEGSKRCGHISIVNNDPGVILICYNIMKKYGNIEVVVRCYPEHDKNKCQHFWQMLLKQEVKIKNKKWLGTKRKTYSENGICMIRTSNMKNYLKIIAWISELRKEYTGLNYNIDPSKSITRSGLYASIEY